MMAALHLFTGTDLLTGDSVLEEQSSSSPEDLSPATPTPTVPYIGKGH